MTSPPARSSEFDRETGVTARGEGTYDAILSDGWRVGGGVNGGYLLAVVGRAMSEAGGDHPDPFVVSAHYLSASVAGPAQVAVSTVRAGRSLTTLDARLTQEVDGEERVRLAVLAQYGDLGTLTDEVATTAREPDLPPREQCLDAGLAPDDFKQSAPLLDRFDLLSDPATTGWAWGEPSRRGLLQGWFRINDRDLDPLGLLFAVDAFPPVTFDLGRLGWAPTCELTVHIRARPAPGWAKVRVTTSNVAGGYFEEDAEVWDSEGRLVAQSRQLARTPR